jgi:outer membrane lipoprotein LolB
LSEPIRRRPGFGRSSRRRAARRSGGLHRQRRRLKAELERALAQAAASSEGVGEAFLQVNRLLAHEPDKAATLRLVRTLAQPYPNVAEAHYAVALAALNAGLADASTATAALQAIDRALALKPRWERAVLVKAEILGRQSIAQAADYLEEFLKAEPDSKAGLASLAQVRVEQKRYADARAIFQRLWDTDRGNPDYQFAVAALAFQMKDWVAAEALFAELERAGYGENGVVELYLAQIAEETARYALALERYRAVPAGDRAWPAKLRAAAMLGKLSRVDEARRYLAELPAVTVEQRREVRQAEAQLLRDAGDNAGAYTVLTQALVDFPDDPDLLYDVAMVAEKLDRLGVVEARLTRLIELRPSNAQALNALGYTLVDRTPRIDEGLALIERALALAPDDPFILDSPGWAHFRLGKLDDAEKYLRRAMAERPDPEIAAHLGEVLWVKGSGFARGGVAVAVEGCPENRCCRDDAPPGALTASCGARHCRAAGGRGIARRLPASAESLTMAPAPSTPFALEGRLSARQGTQGFAAHFAWTHVPPRDELVVQTPLGQGIAELDGDTSVPRVVVRMADGRRDDARDWGELTARTLGVALPVTWLAAWVRGAPHADAPHSAEVDAMARASVLRQNGWEIVYAYADETSRLPSRLRLAYPDIAIAIVVDRWRR